MVWHDVQQGEIPPDASEYGQWCIQRGVKFVVGPKTSSGYRFGWQWARNTMWCAARAVALATIARTARQERRRKKQSASWKRRSANETRRSASGRGRRNPSARRHGRSVGASAAPRASQPKQPARPHRLLRRPIQRSHAVLRASVRRIQGKLARLPLGTLPLKSTQAHFSLLITSLLFVPPSSESSSVQYPHQPRMRYCDHTFVPSTGASAEGGTQAFEACRCLIDPGRADGSYLDDR